MRVNRNFAVCIDNTDYTAALEVRKIYQVLPDAAAAARSYLRIIDESGEDYLYPRRMFRQSKQEDQSAHVIQEVTCRRRSAHKREPPAGAGGHEGGMAESV